MGILKNLFGRKKRDDGAVRGEAAPLSLRREQDGRIIGYQYSMTGVFGYEFYRNGQKICWISSAVIPQPPVMISGFDRQWESAHEESTLVPGLTRIIWDCGNACEACRLIYNGDGSFSMTFHESERTIKAHCSTEGYHFTEDDALIARITRTDSDVYGIQTTDLKPFFAAEFMEEGMEEECLLAILAFPMLCFGI